MVRNCFLFADCGDCFLSLTLFYIFAYKFRIDVKILAERGVEPWSTDYKFDTPVERFNACVALTG